MWSVFTKPGVAGAVLQTPLQTQKLQKVHLPPPVMCHVYHVMSHMSHVMCPISHVTCHMSCFFFFDKLLKLIGGGFVINGDTPSSFNTKIVKT